MKRHLSSHSALGCIRCPAYAGPLGAQVSVQNLTRIPSQRVLPAADNPQDVVLTSIGR